MNLKAALKMAAAAPVALALTGCATDKPLMQQASEGLTSLRTSVASVIAPSDSTKPAAEAAKKAGVTWDDKFADKAKSNVVVATARSAAATFTSLNGEYVTVSVADSKRGSKFPSEVKYGLISLENCSPTLMGRISAAASSVLPGAATVVAGTAGQAVTRAIPGGAVGNVVRTEANRTTTAAANDVKGQILNGATSLSTDQQIACKTDIDTVAAEVKATGSKMLADYSKVYKGSAAVVTYVGTADLKDLQLAIPTGRAPR